MPFCLCHDIRYSTMTPKHSCLLGFFRERFRLFWLLAQSQSYLSSNNAFLLDMFLLHFNYNHKWCNWWLRFDSYLKSEWGNTGMRVDWHNMMRHNRVMPLNQQQETSNQNMPSHKYVITTNISLKQGNFMYACVLPVVSPLPTSSNLLMISLVLKCTALSFL